MFRVGSEISLPPRSTCVRDRLLKIYGKPSYDPPPKMLVCILPLHTKYSNKSQDFGILQKMAKQKTMYLKGIKLTIIIRKHKNDKLHASFELYLKL